MGHRYHIMTKAKNTTVRDLSTLRRLKFNRLHQLCNSRLWCFSWRRLLFLDGKLLCIISKMNEEKRDIVVKGGIRSSKCQSAVELSEYLKLSVKNILNCIDEENFVTIYKTCYKEFEKKDEVVRPSLSGSSTEGKKYYSQFKDMVMKSTFRKIEETVLNLDHKLKELEELKLSQLDSDVYWRPPGNVYQHMIPFEFMSEIEKKKELENKIEKEQEALSILKTRLNQKRIKAKELNDVLLSSIEEIKSIVASKINDEQLQKK